MLAGVVRTFKLPICCNINVCITIIISSVSILLILGRSVDIDYRHHIYKHYTVLNIIVYFELSNYKFS